MKNKFSKALCLILALVMLIPCFAVFSFAADGDDAEQEDTLQLIFNRTFDEGWDYDNGYNVNQKIQKFSIDYEQSADFNYNYFMRFTVMKDQKSDYDGHIQFDFSGTPLSGGGVLEFDLKVDSMTNLGHIAYFLTDPAAAKRDYVPLYRIDNNDLVLDFSGSKFTVAKMTGQWMHLATVFNFNQDLRMCGACKEVFNRKEQDKCSTGCESSTNNPVIQMRVYFGETDIYNWEEAINADEAGSSMDTSKNTYYKDYNFRLTRDYMPATISTFRFGSPEYKENSVGMSYCVDNLVLYYDSAPTDADGNPGLMTPVNDIQDVDKYGYGSRVNKNKTKTIQLLSGGGGEDYIAEGLVMKVGSDYMLNKKERQPIFTNSTTGKAYGAPMKINGVTYVPFETILEATGYPIYVHEDGISYDISTASGSSLLTIGRNTAVVNGEKVDLKAAPITLADPDDENNTYPVIAMEDVEKFFQGYYVTYDEMGLIIISKGENILNRTTDLNEMIGLMTDFIYDFNSTEELLELMKENTNNFDHPYLIVEQDNIEYMRKVYNGEIEDALYKGWIDEYMQISEERFKRFTTLTKNPANPNYFTKACDQKPEKYQLLAHEITNPFSGIKEGEVWTDDARYTYVKTVKTEVDGKEVTYYYPSKIGDKDNGEHFNAGYDYAGSRNSMGVSYADYMLNFATAYLITEDEKYAEIAYDMLISFCDKDNWYDWSHKHFLSVGETMIRLGLAYDWLYDVWTEIQHKRAEEYDLAYITQTIAERAYSHSYETSRYGIATDVWTRDTSGYVNGMTKGAWNWSKVEINWNCVCNCGLVIGAMAIVGEVDDKIDYSYYGVADLTDHTNYVEWTLTNNMWRIAEYGLSQYAPDGSYIESPGYWSYATNYLTIMLAALPGVFGDDLGFYETWGLDRTYYYAVQVEYPVMNYGGGTNYMMWYYNDCGFGGQQDTQVFFIAADFLDDPALAAIRIDGLQGGQKGSPSWIDIIKYKPEYSNISMKDVDMALDWELQSLEGIVARSSWDGFSTFCGIMGNHNNKIQHDQVDSGNFVYSSQGCSWILDLGADDYNIYEYWGNDIRERYYKNSPEGHNTVIITSLQDESQDLYMPYGQSINGGGVLTDYIDGGAAGMYAVVDNSGAYGSITNYARRGMLFTNSRETVVIQDEIAFKGIQSCAWIAHTQGTITIQNGGKTAYITQKLKDNNTYCIRLSLLTDNSRLKFERMTCGIGENDFLMDGANRLGWSESMGGVPEDDRSSFSRLVIKCDNSLVFNCAVVIENVKKLGDDPEIQYDYKQISKWTIDEAYTSSGIGDGESQDSNLITTAKMTDIKTYSGQAAKLIESGYALTTRTTDFFRSLARVTVAVNTYRPETFKNIPQIYSAYEQYLGQLKLYDAYKEDINIAVKESRNMGALFTYTS